MAPTFPDLVRDELVLDQTLVDQMQLAPGRFELLVVARKIWLAGATFVDKDVRIFADEIEELGPTPGITLLTPGVAPLDQTGAAGPTLTIWCRTARAARGRSIGQTGGTGLPGRDAEDLECPPHDPDNPQPIDNQIEGTDGGQGKPGAKGGRGGHIEVNVVGGVLGAQAWLGVGGRGGEGGKGGAGGKGCPPGFAGGNSGSPGLPGGTLGKGDDVAGVVRPVTEAAYLGEIQARVVDFVWADVRIAAADELARRGEPQAAESELTAAGKLEPPKPAVDQLRRRMRHALTPFGVERDVDVVPAVDKHRADWAAAVTRYRSAVLPGGTSVFRFLDREDLLARYSTLRADHAEMVATDLQQLGNERDERITDLTEARKDLGDLVGAARDRITVLVEDLGVTPGVALPGGATIDVRVLADRIAAVLGSPAGAGDVSVRHLLAADLDLLAPVAANDQYPMPGSEALALLRNQAVGLAGADPAPTNPVNWSSPGIVVSFRAVRRELPAAGGDPRLLLELAELTELAQRSRILQLRELQTDEGGIVQELVRQRAAATGSILAQDPEGLSTPALALNYLDAVQEFADVMAWRAHAGERSVSVYTVDSTALGAQFPETSTPPTVAATAPLFDPDNREQLRQELGSPGGPLNVGVLRATENDPQLSLAAYKQRGTFVEGRGDSAVDPLVFSSDDDPAVIARLKLNRNVWFDATLEDLSAARFEGKVVGVGLVFEGLGVNLPPGQPIRELDVLVEHSGISQQRRLDGTIVPQYLLPGEVRVTVSQLADPGTGIFTDVWTGFMRFDDTSPPGEPAEPGQTVGLPQDFPLWGRGAAAGWRLRFANPALPLLTGLRRFELEIEYDSFTTASGISLRRVEQPLGALVPGRTVHARAVLTGPAPAGGVKVALSSSNPAALKVPAFVTAPAGADRVDIPVTVTAPSGGTPVRLRATTPDGFSRRALATVPAGAPNQPGPVTRVDVRLPGEANGTLGGVAFDGDRLLAAYGPTRLHPDGTLEATGPGGMLSLLTSASGMSNLQRFPIGKGPRAIAVANGRAYLVNGDPSAYGLSIVDLRTNKQMAQTSIGFSPVQVAVDARANLVYVSNHGQRRVEVIEGTTGAKLETVGDIRGPQGLAVDPRRRRIYVAATFHSNGPGDTENGLAVVVRSASGAHTLDRIVAMEGRNLPMDVAVDTTRDLVHVANLGVAGEHQPGISTFRAADLTLLGHTPVPGPVLCLDVHLASGAVYCAGPAPTVHVVDGVQRRHVTTHPVSTNVQSIVVHQPSGAVFTGDRTSGEVARLAPVDVRPVTWR